MRQIDDYCWGTDYENNKRKVLSLFFINDAYATLKWGWNFDFVPKKSGNKATYARTDKSVYTHIFELSPTFYKSDNSIGERDKVIISRYSIDIADLEKGLAEKVQHHKDVFYLLLPLMKSYFDITATYEGILENIRIQSENEYHCFINPQMVVVNAFIERYLDKIPYADIEHLDDEKVTSICESDGYIWSHTLTEQIQGQIDAGFAIAGFYEDIGSTALDQYINSSIATKAVKL